MPSNTVSRLSKSERTHDAPYAPIRRGRVSVGMKNTLKLIAAMAAAALLTAACGAQSLTRDVDDNAAAIAEAEQNAAELRERIGELETQIADMTEHTDDALADIAEQIADNEQTAVEYTDEAVAAAAEHAEICSDAYASLALTFARLQAAVAGVVGNAIASQLVSLGILDTEYTAAEWTEWAEQGADTAEQDAADYEAWRQIAIDAGCAAAAEWPDGVLSE